MTVASISGKPLLGSSPVQWSLRSGTRPNLQAFDMIPEDAKSLIGKRVTLQLPNDVTVQNLYALNVVAGENPAIARLVLADRRVWWSYKHIYRYYNMRRNVGFRRIVDPASPPENLSVQPVTWYAKWSLKNSDGNAAPDEAKWKAQDVLEDVLKSVGKKEQEVGGPGITPDLAGVSNLRQLDIENLLLNDPGDQAVGRVLRFLPEAGLYIALDGSVVVYNKASGGEKTMIVDVPGPKVIGQGDVRLVDNSQLRPREVHVLFTYEPEIRFDFNEASTSLTDDDRYAENVLPLPDFTLTIAGETQVQGTWVAINQDLFDAWGTPPGMSSLSHDIIQKALVPYMDFWAGFELAGSQQVNADWAARIAAIEQHYRRTYRINRHWMDRILSLKPYRIATVHRSKGTRAPALAYADYCILGSQRSLFAESKSGVSAKDLSYAINVKAYPNDDVIASTTKAAPAEVEILDADQGIIHIEYKVDPYRVFDVILPSMMTQADRENDLDSYGKPLVAGPWGDPTGKKRSISFDAVSNSSLATIAKLTKNHKASVIMTAIPAAPNTEAQFYRVRVLPAEVTALLGARSVGSSKGPVMEIKVGSSIETARIAWLDSAKERISRLFGVPDDTNTDQSNNIKDLVLNDGASQSGAASLQAIARAFAARLYATLVDRYQGEMATNMNPLLTPAGWLSEVTHIVGTDGSAFTRLSLPEEIAPLDVFSFLDSSIRALVLKLATPDRTV